MGARSSWRPPWFDSTMPSTPRSANFFASSTLCTPLIASLPGQRSRMILRSSNEMVGSIAMSSRSPTVPPVAERDANSSFGVVRKSIHHHGRGSASTIVFTVSCGGMENPLRLSRRRAPATGVSTVKKRVSNPAFAARSTRRVGDLALPHHVELEPVAAVGVRLLHVLDGGGAEGGEGERDAGGVRGAGAGGLALGLHQAGEAGRGDAEGHRRRSRRRPSRWCRRARRRGAPAGGTRRRGTPAGRAGSRSRPPRSRPCSRTPPSGCAASRSSGGPRS